MCGCLVVVLVLVVCVWGGEVGCPPYNGLYEEVSLKRGSFFRFQVYERARISPVEVYESVGK